MNVSFLTSLMGLNAFFVRFEVKKKGYYRTTLGQGTRRQALNVFVTSTMAPTDFLPLAWLGIKSLGKM
jgi:hypothetical protein